MTIFRPSLIITMWFHPKIITGVVFLVMNLTTVWCLLLLIHFSIHENPAMQTKFKKNSIFFCYVILVVLSKVPWAEGSTVLFQWLGLWQQKIYPPKDQQRRCQSKNLYECFSGWLRLSKGLACWIEQRASGDTADAIWYQCKQFDGNRNNYKAKL